MSIELAKTCASCEQQYFSYEAPGVVCMDCAQDYSDEGIQVCVDCGIPIGEFEPAPSTKCVECQGISKMPSLRFSTYVCGFCRENFTPFKRGQVNCSNDCAQKAFKSANKEKYYEPWNDRRKANWHKRRALKMELPADNIRPLEVYERDEWICGLCDKPVDRDSKWPAPLSPSLDHVTPLSLGGHHVYENVQLAHLRCNVSKGARVEVQ